MNQLSRYGLAAIVVACLLALVIGVLPHIELLSGKTKNNRSTVGFDLDEVEGSTELSVDEIYELYIGPEPPKAEDELPPPPGSLSLRNHRPNELKPTPILDVEAIFEDQKRITDILDDHFETSHLTVRDGPSLIIDRFPPNLPLRFVQGNHSGYCTVRFDVSPPGQTKNVETLICTSDLLKAPTIKAVQKWRYPPKILEGQPVERLGIETKIRFDLQDENGILLPLPEGF